MLEPIAESLFPLEQKLFVCYKSDAYSKKETIPNLPQFSNFLSEINSIKENRELWEIWNCFFFTLSIGFIANKQLFVLHEINFHQLVWAKQIRYFIFIISIISVGNKLVTSF